MDESTPGPTPRQDFAELLAAALDVRGLSLARIREHLAAEGLTVSVATLSYWANGLSRPTRARSLDVVRGLEKVLDMPRDTLVEAMQGTVRPFPLGEVLGHDELVRRALEMGLPRSDAWTPVMMHLQSTLDEDGREARTDTRVVQVAEQAGAQRWTSLIEHEPGCRVRGEGFGVTRLERSVEVDPTMTGLVFTLDEPLSRGASVAVHHAASFEPHGAAFEEMGLALRQQLAHLVLEVRFAGPRPMRVFHRFRAPGDGETVEAQGTVLVSGSAAQLTVARAPAGLHQLCCEW